MSDQNPELPMLENLNTQMRCGIFTNAGGEILIIHDQKIEGVIDYIQYDLREPSFSLIFDDGKIQNLGIDFDEIIKSNLLHGSEVTLAYMDAKTIQSSQKVLFLINKD